MKLLKIKIILIRSFLVEKYLLDKLMTSKRMGLRRILSRRGKDKNVGKKENFEHWDLGNNFSKTALPFLSSLSLICELCLKSSAHLNITIVKDRF